MFPNHFWKIGKPAHVSHVPMFHELPIEPIAPSDILEFLACRICSVPESNLNSNEFIKRIPAMQPSS
jgi:hypothetical protein